MLRPHRILYIDLAPSVGGSVISLYHLVKGLSRDRYEPHVVLSRSNSYAARFTELDIDVITVGDDAIPRHAEQGTGGGIVSGLRRSQGARWLKRSPMGEWAVHTAGFHLRTLPTVRRAALELGRVIRDSRPDLVHLNDVVCVSRAGIMAAHRARVPALCHLRAMAGRNHFDRRISRSLRGFICISRAVDRHQRRLGGRVEPSWVVYNGLDLRELDDLGTDRSIRTEMDAEFGFHPDDVILGCIGRLVAWKGHHVFLNAVAEIYSAYPKVRVLIVGSAQEHERSYAQELVDLAHERGLSEIVTFTGYRRDALRLLRGMDVMVHASIAPEPFGRVIIEGMAAGAVVIGTDAGAVAEIIQDGVTGFLVPPNDPESMAQRLAYVIDRPRQRDVWRQAARRTVERRFTAEQYVVGIEQIYESVLT